MPEQHRDRRHRQIKTGAVHTGEIANRTIRLGDISLSARSSLRGQLGPQGPQGPAGAAAVKHFAVVNAAGQFVRGDAKSGGSAGAVGSYSVGFAESVSGCAYSATCVDPISRRCARCRGVDAATV